MSFGTQNVERKVLSILKVLQNSQKPAGARIIAQHLKEHGVVLSERAVRYHLRFMDERGLTELVGNRDGRTITEKGLAEIKNALVKDKVTFAKAKLELLAFRTNFDYEHRRGDVPINLSFFNKTDFKKALSAMKPVFEKNLCVSKLVAVFEGGQRAGDIIVPRDKVGFATICSIVSNGALLKAGVPTDSKFSGILQINDLKPMRFIEIIHYQGCSLDPSEIFIKAGMTSVRDAVSTGSGAILANFREIPTICLPVAEQVLAGLKSAGIEGVLIKGNISEPVCEVPVETNNIGLVFTGGLNPVAAAEEAGIQAENHSMSTVMDYQNLIDFKEL
jgi:HTH-type transcriptional regulator, global nitrogen regulator NrpRI